MGRVLLSNQGRTVRKSLKTTNRNTARATLRELEVARAVKKEIWNCITISELFDEYVKNGEFGTEGNKLFQIKKFRVIRPILGSFKLSELSREDIELYRKARDAQKFRRKRKGADNLFVKDSKGAYVYDMYSPKKTTVRKELVALGLALDYAVEKKLWSGDKKSIIPKQKKKENDAKAKDRWLTHKEYEYIFKELDLVRQFWLVCAVNIGCRLSVLENLRWDDVNQETRVLHVRGTKTDGADRHIPISTDLQIWINAIPEERRYGNIVEPWGNYYRDINQICEKLRIPPISANDFRRTFCSWMLQNGVTIDTLVIFMGHSSRTMIERVYGQLGIGDQREAINSLPSFNFVHDPLHGPDIASLVKGSKTSLLSA